MIINGVEVLPGKTERIVVNVAKLPSHSSIDISITVSRAKKPGPVILLSGGLHGDEINGIEIVRRIIELYYHIPEIGTIICIPIINVFGFIHFSRNVPDGKDVNRSFPGNKNGSLAARVAHYLMTDIIPQIDYAIDYHTGGADRTNYPQVRCMMEDKVNERLAKAFYAPFTLNSKFRPGSLRQSAAKLGKNVIVFEGGESGRLDEFAIQKGINGTMRFLKSLKMNTMELPEPKHKNVFIKNSSWVRARASGLFQSLVSSGDMVLKNKIVGYITDPFGDFKIAVKSSANGYVIGLNNNPVVHQGDAIMHIGVKGNEVIDNRVNILE